MTAAPVSRVELLSEAAVQPLHAGREVGKRRLDEQMQVIVHQAVREETPLPVRHHAGQHREVRHTVGIVQVDPLPAVATRVHVVDTTRQLNTRLPGHASHSHSRPVLAPIEGQTP